MAVLVALVALAAATALGLAGGWARRELSSKAHLLLQALNGAGILVLLFGTGIVGGLDDFWGCFALVYGALAGEIAAERLANRIWGRRTGAWLPALRSV
jgi:hypothetical protein